MTSLVLAFFVAGISHAKGTTGTTGITSSEVSQELTSREFAGRFQVSGDLFVTSADGRRVLYRISESRTGKPLEDNTEIFSNWGHTHKVGDKTIGIYIRYGFEIRPDGSVKVSVQQYESMTPDNLRGEVKYGKLIREEKMDLVDFAPINWLAYKDSQMRIVARITPLLMDRGGEFGPENLPIALEKAVLVDRNGKLWGDDLSEGGGKYVAIATHKGTLAISYYPFPGAKEIGVAKGNEMLLTGVVPGLTLRNTKPFLTANGDMKVFGYIIPERKTQHLNSINMIVTNKEDGFLSGLK